MARRRHRLGEEAVFRNHLTSRSAGWRRPTPPTYRALRLRGLREHPDAFTSSFEEEARKPLAAAEARLAPDSRATRCGARSPGGRRWPACVGVAASRGRRPGTRRRCSGCTSRRSTRGRGIGAALLRHAIDEARRDGRRRATGADGHRRPMPPRAQLYEQAGFRSFGIEPRAIRVGGIVPWQEPHDPLPDPTMTLSRFAFPTTIHFGPGARRLVAAHLAEQGIRRPLRRHRPRHRRRCRCCRRSSPSWPDSTSPSTRRSGAIRCAARSPTARPRSRRTRADAVDRPRRRRGARRRQGDRADGDASRATSSSTPGTTRRCARSTRPLPWFVALPTTAGTGSEVGRSSVVSDDVTHVKKIIFSPKLLAKAVFADPELTLDLPAGRSPPRPAWTR